MNVFNDAIKAKIVSFLNKLISEGGDHNLLIISVGGVYIQFPGARGSQNLICEVISNQFLSQTNQLSTHSIKKLCKLGFTPPDSNNVPNFTKIFNINSDVAIKEVGDIVLFIFLKIFKIDIYENLHYDLTLE